MNKDISVVLILLFGALVIGSVLFFIARLFVKKEIENTTAPKATMRDILHAVLVVGCLLILVYLSTAGHVWAAISFAVIMFIAQIWGNYIVRKNKVGSVK
jgi:nitrate reductase gamma subunit